MVKFLIHTYNSRLWYVKKFLIPSLRKQGIKNISVYNDKDGEGQLKSLIKSYECVKDKDAWHLQDDIVISKNFKEFVDKYDSGIVCGFCNSYSRGRPGYVGLESMWYSMPCIRIPGQIFKEFIEWMQSPNTYARYKPYFDENKHDDVFLHNFLRENYPKIRLWNVSPNMVNHIDHLIGGSIINRDRGKELSEIMAKYWDEPDVLNDITEKLKIPIRC